jgi:GTPase SAR1 family protein
VLKSFKNKFDGAFLVYDVNKRNTFENCCDYWLKNFREEAKDDSIIFLVGN